MIDRIQIDAHCPIEEMARICFVNKELKPRQEDSELSLWIYSREGENIPHMHVRRKGAPKKEPEVCIRFYEATYFAHGSKIGKLKKEECEWVDSMLRQKFSSKLTYWELAISEWNATNVIHDDKLLPEDLKQPDYTKLK